MLSSDNFSVSMVLPGYLTRDIKKLQVFLKVRRR